MEFLSSICCCFHRSSPLSADAMPAVAAQPLIPTSLETNNQIPILVPHFPVKPNLSRL